MKDTVIILGSHPGTRDEFDFSREDCDIWVFNEAAQKEWCKRADAVFQMHNPVIWRNPANRNHAGHYDWLTGGETPTIYMQEAYLEIPKAERYPIEDVRKNELMNFNGGQQYYTSSPAYALALAIERGYKRIEIYGVEMETDTEYRFQRDGIAFWIGVAVGKGIEVDLHSKQFLIAPLYGYEGDVKLEYEHFTKRVEQLEEMCRQAQGVYEAHKAETNRITAHFTETGEKPDDVIQAVRAQVNLAYQFGLVDGARQENQRYIRKADIMKQASGGDFIFVRQEFEQAIQSLVKEKEKEMQIVNAFAVQLGTLFDKAVNAKSRDRRRVQMNEFTRTMNTYITESLKLGIFLGAANENKIHLDKLTELIRAAGGSKSEAVMMEALQCA